MKDREASPTRKTFVMAICALLVALVPSFAEGRGRGYKGHSGPHGLGKQHGSFHHGAYGHRSFGHRSFGHRSFGHRSFGFPGFGHRSFGHRPISYSFGSRFGQPFFRHRSLGHRSFGHRSFGHRSYDLHTLRRYAVQPLYGTYGVSPAYDVRHYGAPQPVAPAPAPIIIIQQPVAVPQTYVTPPAPAPQPIYQPPAHNPNARPSPRREPGQVYLWIEQGEAEVYLDEDFLGTGDEITSLDDPLSVPAGVHVLSVEHRDYGAEKLVFASPADDAILIEINLSGNRSGRKARLRSPAEVESRLQLLGR
ncbi:MAG: hypothetical protein AAF657_02420 [Acidobacteriota bacterium]